MTDFLVFEAEDLDSLEPAIDPLDPLPEGFRIVTTDDPLMVGFFDNLVLPPDTNASGGAALYTVPDPSWFATTGTWKLEFSTAGVYSLYVHYSLYDIKRDPNYDNEDSLFLPLDFDEPPVQDGRFDLSTRDTMIRWKIRLIGKGTSTGRKRPWIMKSGRMTSERCSISTWPIASLAAPWT